MPVTTTTTTTVAMEDQPRPPSPTTVVNADPPPSPKTYELTACSIYYAKPTTTLDLLFKPCSRQPPPAAPYIIRDVSLTARPGELLAIVGPSGAGKSTLLDILAARTSPTIGSLLLNSAPLHQATFRRLSAHVPQHDASLPHLTVAETFAFAARLLSSPARSVSALLDDLRLSHAAHTRLSGNLSGGERRRISIGLSLLPDPAVLLLDEPTSGLDSASAFHIVQTLRSIAAARCRTVVLSIHQPSFKLLSAIDSILLLSAGAVLHHGTLPSLDCFLTAAGFTVPAQLNPLEYAMEILHQLPHPTTPSTTTTTTKDPTPTRRHDIQYASSRPREILALYGRACKTIYRSRQLLLTNTLESLIVGLLLGSIYYHAGDGKLGAEKRLGFFAFTLTFLLSSTTETLPIFATERPILLREASAGLYRLSSHLIANTLVFLPYLLVIALLYSTAVYPLVRLCATWRTFLVFTFIVWATVLTANSFVLLVSAVAPDYIAGTSLVAVALAGFFLFSGYFISKDSMPAYWLFMHYLSPYKYALDALLANEYGCAAGRCFGWATAEEGGGCMVRGRDVLERRGIREGQSWANLRVLFGFFAFYRLLYWVVLTRRMSRSKK